AELKLTPVEEAPANLLLRRVYLDLVGLPPTVEELEEFISVSPSLIPSVSPSANDRETGGQSDRENAYNAVVDKLLASPQYGERPATSCEAGTSSTATSGSTTRSSIPARRFSALLLIAVGATIICMIR